jgi:outer membrane protein OmpA-like peptidoglycan-associated protein
VARVTETEIEIGERIHFRFNSSVIEPASYPMLDAIAAALREHPEVTQVSIEGHADSTGSSRFNFALSKARAEAVKSKLMERGIAPGRLVTLGWGEEIPLSDNATHTGRSLNRRVEFHITERR